MISLPLSQATPLRARNAPACGCRQQASRVLVSRTRLVCEDRTAMPLHTCAITFDLKLLSF